MKIYTKTGDDGTTGILGKGRVPKNHPRIEACGSVDELNACLGVTRSTSVPDDLDNILKSIQNDLFVVGAVVADPQGSFQNSFSSDHVENLEHEIDRLEKELQPLVNFIIPGGTVLSANLHLARTICRRAERSVVTVLENPSPVLNYLNRLSDLLFVMARVANSRSGKPDHLWTGSE